MAKIELEERDGVVGKVCTKCQRWLSLNLYYKEKRGVGGRKSYCRDCAEEYMKKYRQENREKAVEYTKKYYQENKEKVAEFLKKYYQENKEKFRVNKGRRRAIERSLPAQYKRMIEQAPIKRFASELSNESHLDHVIPLSIGHGGTISSNLVYMPAELNISKSNRNIFEWFNKEKERFNLDQNEFDEVITHLAYQNGLTPSEYREFVDWCHENPRTLNEVKADKRHSIEIWREQAGRPFPLPSYTTTYYSNEVSNERQAG